MGSRRTEETKRAPEGPGLLDSIEDWGYLALASAGAAFSAAGFSAAGAGFSAGFSAALATMAAKEGLAVAQKKCIAKAAAALIAAEDFVFLDAGSTTLALIRELNGPALDARYVTSGVAHARMLAQKGCRVFLLGGLLRPETEAIIGAAALYSLQQYNFTKAFLGANAAGIRCDT